MLIGIKSQGFRTLPEIETGAMPRPIPDGAPRSTKDATRVLLSFSEALPPLCLLIGPNGGGKTALLDLAALPARVFCAGAEALARLDEGAGGAGFEPAKAGAAECTALYRIAEDRLFLYSFRLRPSEDGVLVADERLQWALVDPACAARGGACETVFSTLAEVQGGDVHLSASIDALRSGADDALASDASLRNALALFVEELRGTRSAEAMLSAPESSVRDGRAQTFVPPNGPDAPGSTGRPSVDGSPAGAEAALADFLHHDLRLHVREIEASLPSHPNLFEKYLYGKMRGTAISPERHALIEPSGAERQALALLAEIVATKSPGLVIVESPERDLYPENVEALGEALHVAVATRPGLQIFASSHHPRFIDSFSANEVLAVGLAVDATSPPPYLLSSDPLIAAMEEEGVPLSQLWYGGYFR